MFHRHLHPSDSPGCAAIDDTIERGLPGDWAALSAQAKADPGVVAKILRVCNARCADPGAQRHHLWRLYAEHLAGQPA